jgi:DNA-binding transcriptional LysR family regulator
MRRHRTFLGILLAAVLVAALLAAAALGTAKPSVSLTIAANTGTVGSALRLTGMVHNTRAGSTSVLICERVGTQWQTITAAKLSGKRTFAADVTLAETGTLDLRAAYRYRAGRVTVEDDSSVVVIAVVASPGE